ncbi:MAG: hypothetical protein ACREKQ_04645 [Candidatus Rokuibacteriota bacterium]
MLDSSALMADWQDVHAAREGFWRSTPSLAHRLPPAAEGKA